MVLKLPFSHEHLQRSY